MKGTRVQGDTDEVIAILQVREDDCLAQGGNEQTW